MVLWDCRVRGQAAQICCLCEITTRGGFTSPTHPLIRPRSTLSAPKTCVPEPCHSLYKTFVLFGGLITLFQPFHTPCKFQLILSRMLEDWRPRCSTFFCLFLFHTATLAAMQKCKEKNTKIDRDTGDNGDKCAEQQN
jgi:hypothetical protein